jgi:tetratricopeptide (TPR) repeat protein
MNTAIKIVLGVLFISLHLNTQSLLVESYAIFYLSVLCALLLAVFAKIKEPAKINAGHWPVMCFSFFLFLHFLISGNPYGGLETYSVLICWVLFFVFSFFFFHDGKIIQWGTWFVILTVAIEILLGFAQLLGFINNNDEYFSLGGSFGNPNAYGGYLAVVSPLVLSLFLAYHRIRKAEHLYYMLGIIFIFTLFMLSMSRSRGACLASALGCIFVLNRERNLWQKVKHTLKSPVQKGIAVISVVCMLSAGSFLLYQLKADSAFGRVLVWKVIATTPHDHLLLGNGSGYVEANYGKWQAAYFAAGKGSDAERYVADYVTCAYNEPIEMILEHGFVGLFLLAGLFYVALRQKKVRDSSLVSGAKASLVALIVLMLISYPLKITSVYLYFVFCLAVIFYPAQKQKSTSIQPVTFLFGKWARWTFLLFIPLILAGIYRLYGYYQLKEGQKQVFSGQIDRGIEAYTKAAAILQNDGIFHFYYGSALSLQKRPEECVKELEASIEKSSNPNSYILLGNSYKELGKFEAAKESYLMAIHILPVKLYPKYVLTKLLIEKEEYGEAGKWAQEILQTKEKVATTAAKEIKAEMQRFLSLPGIWQLGKNDLER